MPTLQLALLGAPEVRHAGRPVALATRKALALLVYLAVEGGTHYRDKLVALFWPESDVARGRATLRSTLAFVRRELGTDHLRATRETLAFAGTGCLLDLRLIDEAARATRRLPLRLTTTATEEVQPVLEQLREAASAFRGEFLDGFSLSDAPEFDDWASLQREVWHRKATLVFDWLSQLQFAGGEFAPAIETATRWRARDPLNEVAYRRLIQLHIATGDRIAALQVYEACRATLARELAAEPAPETEALARRLRVRPAPDQRQSPDLAALPAETPLVGRVAEHSALTALYHQARRGGCRLTLLEGEPGIGKTRLAREFLAWAVAQGAEVLAGRAFELGNELPYQALVAALREWLARDEHPARRLRDVLGATWLGELRRLLPELVDYLPDLPAPLTPSEAEARARLYETVARLGQGLARTVPLVWFVDDLHWADAATLDLLGYAARRWRALGTPVLLLLAARTEELHSPRPGGTRTLADWLAGLSQDVPPARLALGQLEFADTVALVRSLAPEGGEPPDRLAARIHAETGGQPFFIVQVLKALVVGEVAGRLTPGIRELVRARLSRLSPPARAICAAGAVFGASFTAEQGLVVAGLAGEESLDALEDLLRRGLMRVASGRYLLAHDFIREVVYVELGEARRRLLHHRALLALEGAGASDADLARHALVAGLRERAYRFSVAAGHEAARLFASRGAVAHYELARALLDDRREAWQASVPAAERVSLHLRLGRAYEILGQWAESRACYESARDLAREAADAPSECLALNRLATLAAQSAFDLAGAFALLQQARLIAERGGDRLGLAEAEWNLAQLNFYRWDLPACRAHGERALALARELGTPDLLARTLNVITYHEMMTGVAVDVVVQHAEEGRQLCARLGNRSLESDFLSVMATVQVHWGRVHAGIANGRAGMALGLEVDSGWGYTNNAYNVVYGLLDLGELVEALTLAETSVERARGGHPPTLTFNLLALGAVHRALFALDEALATHHQAAAIASRFGHPLLEEWAAVELCADYVALEQWSAACDQSLAALARRDYTIMYTGFTHDCEAEALARSGEVTRAVADLGRYRSVFRHRIAGSRLQALFARSEAVLAEVRGDHVRACRLLLVALNWAERRELRNECWRLRARLAALQRLAGDATRAEQFASVAVATVIALAARIPDELPRERFVGGVAARYQLPGLLP